MACIICKKERFFEYFDGVSGKICADCLKSNMLYFAIKKLNLLKERRIK